MGEIEKLRALLAEARKALSYGCWSGSCCRVRAKIDAALAEPYNIPINEECSGEHGCANLGLGKNIWTPEYDYCDERNITHYPPCPLAYSQSDNDPAAFLGEGFVALLAEPVSDDFRRGAEAMRKAAVTYFQCGPYDGCNNGEHDGECDNCETADIIDALPIPEDK